MSSSTGNARALADDGVHTTPPRYSQGLAVPGATETSHSNMLQPPSPSVEGRRLSLTPGGTTKVLADLQTGVINARNALENTKAQLRLSQRSVAQLTRQTEDLKEVRERLRLENEGLNNVVARKERLLQEVRFTFVKRKYFDSSSWRPGSGAGTESRGGGSCAQSSVKSRDDQLEEIAARDGGSPGRVNRTVLQERTRIHHPARLAQGNEERVARGCRQPARGHAQAGGALAGRGRDDGEEVCQVSGGEQGAQGGCAERGAAAGRGRADTAGGGR